MSIQNQVPGLWTSVAPVHQLCWPKNTPSDPYNIFTKYIITFDNFNISNLELDSEILHLQLCIYRDQVGVPVTAVHEGVQPFHGAGLEEETTHVHEACVHPTIRTGGGSWLQCCTDNKY